MSGFWANAVQWVLGAWVGFYLGKIYERAAWLPRVTDFQGYIEEFTKQAAALKDASGKLIEETRAVVEKAGQLQALLKKVKP